ncbi:DUF5698 domain-containing protein [Brucepastera parasyntrophica]|uniref:DUF2179 domain-containing protein n=1 Tax=Brucepastera parasyntrophica TaxID=2880008 RepID=UPI00210E31BD|nr:DUF5698 domain-containing protein [Brucepastera parasyntrophica]ULQ59438.1 DUF5698 domain-containing protein [Brucepastera parasyntrophica]
MWEAIVHFFTAAPWWELVLILISKIAEVSMGTVRHIMINRGYRRQGTILAFFEVILWVLVVSSVISGLTEAPLKGLVYSIGFAAGVNIGSRIENKLAYGKILIQTITSREMSFPLATELRGKGYGVTTIDAEGKDAEKAVLMIFANRKGKEDIIAHIQKIDKSAMIITNDVSTLHGGFISQRKSRSLMK